MTESRPFLPFALPDIALADAGALMAGAVGLMLVGFAGVLIFVAAIVENAGFGATHAAPLVRRVMDYWLAGLLPSEQDMKAVQQGQATAPIGTIRSYARGSAASPTCATVLRSSWRPGRRPGR